jgi:hypothetical protein
MTERRDCAEVRDLLPEVAAGVAAGDERAKALRHLSGCAECRRDLAALAMTADELLTLVPAFDPPAGFESAVLNRITQSSGSARSVPLWAGSARAHPVGGRRWPRRVLRLAVTAALAVTIGVGLGGAVTMRATADDRRVAAACRETLDAGTLTGHVLTSPEGETAGKVFTYPGKPPYVFVMVRFGVAGSYEVGLITKDGSERVIGTMSLAWGIGSWTGPLDVGLDQIAEIRLAGAGAAPLTAVIR